MAQDTYDCEGHTGKVTVSVTHENLGRILIVFPESESDQKEGDDKSEGEDMVIHYFFRYAQVDFLKRDKSQGIYGTIMLWRRIKHPTTKL